MRLNEPTKWPFFLTRHGRGLGRILCRRSNGRCCTLGAGQHRQTSRLTQCNGSEPGVSGGENPRIDGDVAGCEWSAFCGESAVVLATVKDARRRFAVAFGHP